MTGFSRVRQDQVCGRYLSFCVVLDPQVSVLLVLRRTVRLHVFGKARSVETRSALIDLFFPYFVSCCGD